MRSKTEFKQEEKYRLLSLFRKPNDGSKNYEITEKEREYLYNLIRQQISRVERRRIGKV